MQGPSHAKNTLTMLDPQLKLKSLEIPKLENDDHENIGSVVHSLEGEGTCRPYGSTCKLSIHLALNIVCNCFCCLCSGNKGLDLPRWQKWQRK